MPKYKQQALISVCALATGASLLSPASAASYGKSDIFGGGASVPAPYARQTFDCFANPTDLIIAGTPPQLVAETPFNYTGSPAQNCATQHITTKETTYYISASAGTGILATFAHDPTLYGEIDGQGDYFPSIQFGMSTTSLVSNDVDVYNNGGTETQGKNSITIAAPNAYQCNSGSKNPYPNPLQCYGPLVQFPFAITPIVFAYNSVYKKVINNGVETDYHFNVQYERGDGSGGLHLSPGSYCAIFNGQITNWNDSRLTADNNGVPLYDPTDPDGGNKWSLTLQIVGRSDSSGATSILSRHLASVCAQYNWNQYTTGASTLPTSLQGPTYNVANANYPPVSGETAGKFTLAPNNSGVAQYTAFTATPGGSNPSNCSDGSACIALGRITYSGTDYVLPYVSETGQNDYNLNSATLENSSGNWEDPDAATAQAAYSTILPPQSNSKGQYCASCTTFGYRNDPTAWVQGTSASSLIADPSNTGAYPIVGTANWIAYQCYLSANQEKSLTLVMHYIDEQPINTDSKKGILATAGMAPLSKAWRTAVQTTFVTNADGLGLNIGVAQQSVGTCKGSGIVGG